MITSTTRSFIILAALGTSTVTAQDINENLFVSGQIAWGGGAGAWRGAGAIATINSGENDRPSSATNNDIFRINWHSGLSLSAHSSYGGVRIYNQGYPDMMSGATLVASFTDNKANFPSGLTSGNARFTTGLNGSGSGVVIDANTRTTADNAIPNFQIINRAGQAAFTNTIAGDTIIGSDPDASSSAILRVGGAATIGGAVTWNGGGTAWSGAGTIPVSLPGEASRPNASAGQAVFRINHHTGLSLSAHSYYGGVRIYNQGYPDMMGGGTLVASFTDDKANFPRGLTSATSYFETGKNGSGPGVTIDASTRTDTEANEANLRVISRTGTPSMIVTVGGDTSFLGAVTIGNSTTSQNLLVGGTIKAKEVRVEANPFADYVFDPDYKLMSLSEVAKHIADKRHLPGIPSAAEIVKDGMGVSDMVTKQMAKIEELTLYAIQADRQLAEANRERTELAALVMTQTEQIATQSKQIARLAADMAELKALLRTPSK